MKKRNVLLRAVALTVLCCLLALLFVGCGDRYYAIRDEFTLHTDCTVTEARGGDESVADICRLLMSTKQIEAVRGLDMLRVVMPEADGNNMGQGIVIRFSSETAVEEFFDIPDMEKKRGDEALAAAREEGRINGNCVIFSASSELKAFFREI